MSVRILLDENSESGLLVNYLEHQGHDVALVTGFGVKRMRDDKVLETATNEDRAVLTMNHKDFLTLHRQDTNHAGILVHFEENGSQLPVSVIATTIDNVERIEKDLHGKYIVLNQYRY